MTALGCFCPSWLVNLTGADRILGGRGRALRHRTAARMAVTARSSAGKNSTVGCSAVSSPRPLGV